MPESAFCICLSVTVHPHPEPAFGANPDPLQASDTGLVFVTAAPVAAPESRPGLPPQCPVGSALRLGTPAEVEETVLTSLLTNTGILDLGP